MCRRITVVVVLAFIGLGGASPVHAQDKEAKELAKKLEAKIDLEQGIEANTPLKDALEFLADRFAFKISVDEKAFAKANIQKVTEQPVKLKPLKGVALGKVLQMVLDQVEGTYKIEKDQLVAQPKPKK